MARNMAEIQEFEARQRAIYEKFIPEMTEDIERFVKWDILSFIKDEVN